VKLIGRQQRRRCELGVWRRQLQHQATSTSTGQAPLELRVSGWEVHREEVRKRVIPEALGTVGYGVCGAANCPTLQSRLVPLQLFHGGRRS
jgi:hypothetical protein